MGSRPGAEIARWPAGTAAQGDLVERAAELLRAGEIVAFPTDTVYGIAADPSNEAAVQNLYTVKGRSPEKAIALLVSGPEQLEWITDPSLRGLIPLAEAFWPGGLTIVVPARPDAAVATGQPFSTVGLRMPDHPVPLAIIGQMGYPLATTSANLSGAPSPKTAQDVEAQIGYRVSLIIDAGPCPGGTDSTVIDLTTDPPFVRRIGAIP
ncbi:MAG TPA: L-threonylcarbamoyladenylate synthase, partial [Chloroflexota bacterium]